MLVPEEANRIECASSQDPVHPLSRHLSYCPSIFSLPWQPNRWLLVANLSSVLDLHPPNLRAISAIRIALGKRNIPEVA